MMDMHRGEVIEEWKPSQHGVDQKVRSIAPTTKTAQQTGESNIVATNNNQIFRIDPRTKEKIAQSQDQSLLYSYGASAARLTSVATTDSAQAVVGDEKGSIRFFSTLDKRAKTTLPGLGDGITGVDVTADGKYALATTNTYVLVIPTAHEDGKRTAFDVGLRKKTKPIKLTLDHKDIVRFHIDKLKFTRARFNTAGTFP